MTSLTFASDIKPLFREKDRTAMKRAFDLWSYDDVVAHGEAIAARLKDGSMPCDGPWPNDRVVLFERQQRICDLTDPERAPVVTQLMAARTASVRHPPVPIG